MKRVYDLLLISDTIGALEVVDIEDEVGDMDVVLGVGAIDRLRGVRFVDGAESGVRVPLIRGLFCCVRLGTRCRRLALGLT